MNRVVAALFLALALLQVDASILGRSYKQTHIAGVKGIPVVVESNLPAALNNVALADSQSALDNASSLVDAADTLKDQLQKYQPDEEWNVAIDPAAYFINSHYFAHYIVNSHHVFLYTVNCK